MGSPGVLPRTTALLCFVSLALHYAVNAQDSTTTTAQICSRNGLNQTFQTACSDNRRIFILDVGFSSLCFEDRNTRTVFDALYSSCWNSTECSITFESRYCCQDQYFQPRFVNVTYICLSQASISSFQNQQVMVSPVVALHYMSIPPFPTLVPVTKYEFWRCRVEAGATSRGTVHVALVRHNLNTTPCICTSVGLEIQDLLPCLNGSYTSHKFSKNVSTPFDLFLRVNPLDSWQVIWAVFKDNSGNYLNVTCSAIFDPVPTPFCDVTEEIPTSPYPTYNWSSTRPSSDVTGAPIAVTIIGWVLAVLAIIVAVFLAVFIKRRGRCTTPDGEAATPAFKMTKSSIAPRPPARPPLSPSGHPLPMTSQIQPGEHPSSSHAYLDLLPDPAGTGSGGIATAGNSEEHYSYINPDLQLGTDSVAQEESDRQSTDYVPLNRAREESHKYSTLT